MKVGIVGVGMTACRPSTPEYSWKELMFEGASRAYADAGVDPRADVGSFITCAEDYYEGFGIFDEFVPDQLGAALRPTCTVDGDGIQGLAAAFMQIQTGLVDVVAVEGHSKASDIRSLPGVLEHGLDPVWNRPLGAHPHMFAGLEAEAYLRTTRTSAKALASVVAKNRSNGLLNPLAAYGADVDEDQAAEAPPRFTPLRELDIAQSADGCVTLVVASEKAARRLHADPVWIRGLGWSNESPTFEQRQVGEAWSAELAAAKAFEMGKVQRPATAFDLVEVDDRFSYRELQLLEAAGLAKPGEAGKRALRGDYALEAKLPVNASGGSLGCGNIFEATGLHRVAELALQLRGEAGRHQVAGAKTGLAVVGREIPSTTAAVAVLGVGR